MKLKYLFYCISLFTIGQASVWFQTNSQFISEWAKKNPFYLSLLGIPISLIYIKATNYGGLAFNGNLWPQRFLSFSIGIVIFASFTYLFLGEHMNLKSWISIALAICIISIQVFMKS